jgi:hypothetical protein
VFYLDPLDNYRLPELDQFEWLVYGFGTRRSTPPPVSLATLRQIHSDIVVPAEGRTGCLGEGDALVSNTPGRTVAVKTADCVPILLVDAANRTVAAVHAGWRGTVRQIARQAAEAMRRDFDTRVRNLHVAIGPAIGGCCYEVGPEVAAEFRPLGPGMYRSCRSQSATVDRRGRARKANLFGRALHAVPWGRFLVLSAGKRGGRADVLICGHPLSHTRGWWGGCAVCPTGVRPVTRAPGRHTKGAEYNPAPSLDPFDQAAFARNSSRDSWDSNSWRSAASWQRIQYGVQGTASSRLALISSSQCRQVP